MSRLKSAGFVLFGTAAIAACTLSPTPADATEAPTPTFHTVLWEITSPTADVFLTPQIYVTALESDDTSHWVSGVGLKCGTRYQADAYTPDAIPALIADNLLQGGEDNGLADHWLVFDSPACVPVVDAPAIPHDQPIADYPVSVPVITDIPVDAPVVVSPRADAVVEQVAAKTAAPELAATGFDFATPAGVALLMVLAGLILWSTRFFGKRAPK